MARRHLGEFEQLLMYALTRLGERASGTAIRVDIHERTGRTVSPGAVYTALDRLERRGLVASAFGAATPQRGGKRKRLYRLRPAGVALLRDMHETLAAMSRGLKPKLTP